MNLETLELVASELRSELTGRKFGKIFQLSRLSMAIDFRLPESRYLFVSIEPARARTYSIRRRLKDLERASIGLSPFGQYVRKRLSGAEAAGVEQVPGERVIIVRFAGANDLGEETRYSLVIQLTGRSANLFLLDPGGRIIEAARETVGPGQEVGDMYSAPPRPEGVRRETDEKRFNFTGFQSVSEALDHHFQELDARAKFDSLVNSARSRLKREIAKHDKLIEKLRSDLIGHGDAEKWKRLGDLLLANVSTARRDAGKIVVTDYFDENLPEVEIDADENDSVTETAEKFFRRYTKARNAAEEIEKRLELTRKELKKLSAQSEKLEDAVKRGDADTIARFADLPQVPEAAKRRQKAEASVSGTRTFVSSDGFEILVGKKAKDNDLLTFRVAKSLDLWMHAADYPGSHVVVRNPNRKDIPAKTLLEAAQLAAFYSQGKTQPKAAVHYTQKKFVNKPRGGGPGLVSLSSFKTILVEPKVPAALESKS